MDSPLAPETNDKVTSENSMEWPALAEIFPKDFSVGRQSLADKRREMIPALRDLYLET